MLFLSYWVTELSIVDTVALPVPLIYVHILCCRYMPNESLPTTKCTILHHLWCYCCYGCHRCGGEIMWCRRVRKSCGIWSPHRWWWCDAYVCVVSLACIWSYIAFPRRATELNKVACPRAPRVVGISSWFFFVFALYLCCTSVQESRQQLADVKVQGRVSSKRLFVIDLGWCYSVKSVRVPCPKFWAHLDAHEASEA